MLRRVAAAATRVAAEVDGLQIAPLDGGRNNEVVAVSSDASRWCAKVFRDDRRRWAGREWWGLDYLARTRPGLAPRPIGRADVVGTRVVVMELVTGTSVAGGTATRRDIEQIGGQLAELYALGRAELPEDPGPAMGCPERIVARVRAGWLCRPPPRRDELGRAAHALWRTWLGSSDADRLPALEKRVFGRGDGNLRNWLRSGDELRLVDFEYSGWTSREFDLADTIEHVAAREIEEDSWQVLLDGLKLDATARAHVAAGRRTYALFWLTKLRSIPGSGAPAEQTRHDFALQLERAERVFSGAVAG